MIKTIARTLDLSRCTEHAVAQTPLVRLAAEPWHPNLARVPHSLSPALKFAL